MYYPSTLIIRVKTSLEPDIILLDASTGFTEVGAVALLDQADLGILCFSPATEQSFAGLKWVVKAAKMQRSYRGIPDLRFLLTPRPSPTPRPIPTPTLKPASPVQQPASTTTTCTATCTTSSTALCIVYLLVHPLSITPLAL